MKYEEHSFQQGSPEWHAHRSNCYNASELAAADGASPYKTRSKLINQIAVGEDEEISPEMQKRFDDGHRFEDLARPLAEEYIGEDLFPSVLSVEVEGLSRRLGVSCDGKTIDDRINWEHKSLNAELAASLDQGVIPDFYHYQMEQGMLINGAEKTLFTASKWDGNDNLIDIKHAWYESNPELRARIVPIWKQVEEDAANYQHVEVLPPAVGTAIQALPALTVELTGEVSSSNLAIYRSTALDFIASINTDLQTDQDFADAEKTIKFCDSAERELVLVKSQALSKTASIDELFRTIDILKEEMRQKRLTLEKLVKARKETIRFEILQAVQRMLTEHIAALNDRLGDNYITGSTADFSGVMSGKKTVSSLKDAVATELARAKIETSAAADKIEINLKAYRELAAGKEFLFNDLRSLIGQSKEAFTAMVENRIVKHKAAEDERLEAERERIRKEEEARAQAAVQAAAPAPTTSAGNVHPVTPTLGEVLHAAAPQVIAQAICPVDTGAMIKLGQINERLGFIVAADFLERLGFTATTERSAKLYREAEFPAICNALQRHIGAVAAESILKKAA